MPYSYTLTTVIPATPEEIYQAWLDSAAHSEMTGADASISGEVGAEYSAWDEYITGRNLELVPGQRIVQSWRTSEYADEHDDSVVTVTLEPVEEGTLLTLVHSNVPEEQRDYEEGGWESNYFEPMKVYFARLEQDEATEAAEAPEASEALVAVPSERPAAYRPAAPTPAKKARTKRPAPPKAKAASAKKKKPKRAAPAKSRRKAARPGAKKTKKAVPKRAAKKKSVAKRSASKRKSGGRKRGRR